MMNDTLIFRAIADDTRRRILDMLREAGQMRAGDIAAHFPDVTRIAISKHLRVLRDAALIAHIESDDGRERNYTLNPNGFESLQVWLDRYSDFWQERLDTIKRLAEEPDEDD